MFDLDLSNVLSYLEWQPELPAEQWRVTPLGGGVSNTVLLVESDSLRFVIKQSLGRLRVQEEWLSDRTRIHRECDSMRTLAPYLPPGSVPQILFEDRENCLFAMTAAPAGAVTWKERLLAGQAEAEIAERVAAMLAAVIRVSWHGAAWEERFGDQAVFDQLRLDPYYRFTASKHPDLARYFQARIEACSSRHSLVHGDFSPKNFLVESGSVMAIDFEVIHFGDPSFDAAFFLNHLLLKSFHNPRWAPLYARLAQRFWEVLQEGLPQPAEWFEPATIGHLGCLLLARVDGKSPVEYIQAETVRQQVRECAREIILAPPDTVSEVFAKLNQ